MTSPRILVVDDDPALLQALPMTFELRLPEITVDTCVSAASVLDQIRETEYHAIISDLNMPVMNGLELLREIKKVRPWTPLLLITGNDSEELVREAANAGAYDFIKKPVNRDMLVLSVKRALEAHQWRRDRQKDTTLCLEGLPCSLNIDRFRNWVGQFGQVLRVRIVLDAYDGRSPSAYGCVEFATASEAEHAKRSLSVAAPFDGTPHISFCHDGFNLEPSNAIPHMKEYEQGAS